MPLVGHYDNGVSGGATSCAEFPTAFFDDGNDICDWGYRHKVTIDSDRVDSDLTNFLFMVDLSLFGSQFWASVASDGSDIRVTESDGQTELPSYVSQIDTVAETGVMWVRISGTLSSSADTVLYFYFDNSAASAYATTDTYGRNNCFQDYEAFWDFEQDPSGTAPQLVDLTGNGNDGTSTGGMTAGDEVDGKVGNAWNSDGTNDFVFSSSVTLGNSITLGGWFKADDTSSTQRLISKDDNGTARNVSFYLAATGQYGFAIWSSGTVNNINGGTANTEWQHIIATFESSTEQAIYLNSAKVASDTTSVPSSIDYDVSEVWNLWRQADSSDYFDGQTSLGFLRASALSADYIAAEYANQYAPGSFYTVEPAVSSASVEETLQFPDDSFDSGENINVWRRRQDLTMQATSIPSDQTNPVLMVDLSEMGNDFWYNVSPNGEDIRITDDDGQTELAYDLIFFNFEEKTGTLFFRYSGTLSSSVDTTVYIYWCNALASAYAAGATFGSEACWADYDGVYTFDDGPGSVTDRSGNHASALTDEGSMTSGDRVEQGPLGVALDLDGSNDALVGGDRHDQTNNDYTHEAIFEPDRSTGSAIEGISGKANGSAANGRYAIIRWPNDSPVRLQGLLDVGTAYNILANGSGTTAQYYYAVQRVENAGTHELFLDATSLGTSSGYGTYNYNTSIPWRIGSYQSGGNVPQRWFDGRIAFVAIAFDLKSDDRITTDYNNRSANSTFIDFTNAADKA